MKNDKTLNYKDSKENISLIEKENKEILKGVYKSLIEKGYNPINQLVGYILSGDPTYITNQNNARNKITSIERDKLLKAMIKEYLELND